MYILGGIHELYTYIWGLLWTEDVLSKQERTAASFFLHVTMDHLIEYNWMRVWSTLDDPDPPLTWTEDLQGSKVISNMFSDLNDAQSPHPNLAAPPNQKQPLPPHRLFRRQTMIFCSGDPQRLEDQLIGRSWVLKFFPSQNSRKSSENPSENKTLLVFFDCKGPQDLIFTLSQSYSSLGCLFLTSLAGWGPKSIWFTSQTIFERKEIGTKGSALKTSSYK